MNTPLYRLKNIKQLYGGRVVLDLDHFEIQPNSITGLSGPNGCGKSTLMRILALLESPVHGEVFFQGTPASPAESKMRRQVTMLGQDPFLLQRSVFSNVAYGLKIRGVQDIEDRVYDALNMVGLDSEQFARRPWYQLSGGETQRVALASRLAIHPRVLLLDEPTASLDRKSSELIKKAALKARREQGATVVIVSHDLSWLNQVCDRVLYMEEGRLMKRSEQ